MFLKPIITSWTRSILNDQNGILNITIMGMNIAGILINEDLSGKLEEVQQELGFELIFEEEIDFETASANWKEDDTCDIYFGSDFSLFFISMDRAMNEYNYREANTLCFAISETSMAFNLVYFEAGKKRREIMEVNEERMTDEGEPFSLEEGLSTDSIIYKLMEKLAGKSYFSIQPEEKAFRYRIK